MPLTAPQIPGDVPPIPGGGGKITMPDQGYIDVGLAGIDRQMMNLEGQRQSVSADYANREATTSGQQEQTLKDISTIQGEKVPEVPPLNQPKMPEGPQLDFKDIKGFTGISLALIALMGAHNRGVGLNAMEAFTAGLQGYTQGKKDVAAQHFEEFKTKYQMALDQHKDYLEQRQRILDDRNIRIDQKQTQLRLLDVRSGQNANMYSHRMADISSQEHTQAIMQNAYIRAKESGDNVFAKLQNAGLSPKFNAMVATLQEDVSTGYYRMARLNEMYDKDKTLPAASIYFGKDIAGDGFVGAVKDYGLREAVPSQYQKTDALLLGLAFDIASARSGGRGQLSDAKIREVQHMMPMAADSTETRLAKYKMMENALQEANNALPAQSRVDINEAIKEKDSSFGFNGGGDTPNTNAKGWVLHSDAKGNKAYVNPSNPNEYEEVQ